MNNQGEDFAAGGGVQFRLNVRNSGPGEAFYINRYFPIDRMLTFLTIESPVTSTFFASADVLPRAKNLLLSTKAGWRTGAGVQCWWRVN